MPTASRSGATHCSLRASMQPETCGCWAQGLSDSWTALAADSIVLTGHALLADGAKIGSSVFLANGFRATGEVRLSNVHIARQLAVTNAVLSKPDGYALNLQSARADTFWIRGPGLQPLWRAGASISSLPRAR